jgi:hypothetical protein
MAAVALGAPPLRARRHPARARSQLPGRRRLPVLRHPELALATLTRIAELRLAADPKRRRPVLPPHRPQPRLLPRDPRHQNEPSRKPTYSRAITAFGLGLLNDTGSRKSRRQSDLAADREMSLRQIRAIPHNAILQQLGYPVNVIAGVGSAADGSYEEIAAAAHRKRARRQLIRLVRSANALASIKTVAAYGELFNSAYWASRPYRGDRAAHLRCLPGARRIPHQGRPPACSAASPRASESTRSSCTACSR